MINFKNLIILGISLICKLLFSQSNNMIYNKLTPEETQIIVHKGTERPFSGSFDNFYENGIYTCKRCNAILYSSKDKFNAHCGWPAFDDEIIGAVLRLPDADGKRTEIVCKRCHAHLGHVFLAEGFTPKNTRHCVNSLSLNFIPSEQIGYAYFAAGCFWGVEYYFQKHKGVLSAVSGYMGGHVDEPTYEQVCAKNTGHAETVMLVFNKNIVSFEELCRYFFEIHNFEQVDGQGPDIGLQYRSVVFYTHEKQKEVALNLIDMLTSKGYKVATAIEYASTFWQAENYHQNYYKHKGTLPYCHIYKKIF